MLDRLTPQPRYRSHDAPQILQVGAHASRLARTCDNAASGIRSAWMNSDDFEVASKGYGVQNDRRRPSPTSAASPALPGNGSDAARNDNTNCQAAVFARRSATASTCQ